MESVKDHGTAVGQHPSWGNRWEKFAYIHKQSCRYDMDCTERSNCVNITDLIDSFGTYSF